MANPGSRSPGKKNPAMYPLLMQRELLTSRLTVFDIRTITTVFASMSETLPKVAVSNG